MEAVFNENKGIMNRLHFLSKFFATIILLHLSSNIKAQASLHEPGPGEKKITIMAKGLPIHEIFKSVTKQTGLRFSYNNSDINQNEKITAPFINMPVDNVLKHIFAGKAISWTYIDNIIRIGKSNKDLGPSIIYQGTVDNSLSDSIPLINITGKVTDSKGRPVAGATISINGLKRGQGADNSGVFRFVGAPANGVLNVSSIGFEAKRINIAGQREIHIVLDSLIRDIQGVEIVSTGYQDIPKERATGSFVKINSKILNERVGTNILSRLDGMTSSLLVNVGKTNVNPQNTTGITIRGLSTINGPLDPLIVMDGFIYEGDINNINPNYVESITILKDAAAASIWGARAGNGVIVITTKRGMLNQKLKVDFSANAILTKKTDVFDYPQINSSDIIDVEQMLFGKGYFNNRINLKYQSLTPAVEVFLKRRSGLISANDSMNQINYLKTLDSRHDYANLIYKDGITQQYAVNVRGGTSNNAYAFSFGYDKDINELQRKADKINIKVDNIYQPVKGLSLSLGVNFTKGSSVSGFQPYNSFSIADRYAPYFSMVDKNGKPNSVPYTYREAYLDTAGVGKLLDWKYYPLENAKHETSRSDLQEIFFTTGLQYKVLKMLDFDLRYQYQNQTVKADNYADLLSYQARDVINTFSQLNYTNGQIKYIVPYGGIKGGSSSRLETNTLRAQFNLNKSWTKSAISAIVGGEVRQSKTLGESSLAYGYSPDPLTIGSVDYSNVYRTFIIGDSRKIPGSPTYSSLLYRFVSVYGNATYFLNDKYNVSVSARSDGSNIFGATTNNKWKPLWSAGFGWIISNEDFFRSSVIDNLKFRTTYGYSGNVDLNRSALPIATNFNASAPANLPYSRVTAINNPSLKWEEITQLNFGVEVSILKNRITSTLEYYTKWGNDLYGETPYDHTTWGGANTITRNVASIKGRGIDLQINTININKSVKWNSIFLFNYNTNKTTAYYTTNSSRLSTLIGSGANITPVIGKPLYGIVAYKWGGLDTLGNPQGFLNGQKSIDYAKINSDASLKGLDAGNIIYVGNASPTFFGSVFNDISYKNFSVSFNITYKFDYYFRKRTINYGGLVSQGGGHSDYTYRWQKKGDELKTNIPSFLYPANAQRDNFFASSEINVLKGDHIRFQFINVGYTFEKTSFGFLPFQNIKLYLNAQNLGVLWSANKLNLDPDYPNGPAASTMWTVGIRGNL